MHQQLEPFLPSFLPPSFLLSFLISFLLPSSFLPSFLISFLLPSFLISFLFPSFLPYFLPSFLPSFLITIYFLSINSTLQRYVDYIVLMVANQSETDALIVCVTEPGRGTCVVCHRSHGNGFSLSLGGTSTMFDTI